MCSIDFRQTSNKNTEALLEYMISVAHPVLTEVTTLDHFNELDEQRKRNVLLPMLLDPTLEFDPWVVQSLTKITKYV
jgi:phosphoenolpyruvate carboxylase